MFNLGFPKDHRTDIHSINPLERINGEISLDRRCRHLPKRRYDRPICRGHSEKNDEWAARRSLQDTASGLAHRPAALSTPFRLKIIFMMSPAGSSV
jgi:transposase-like protein